MAPRELLKFGGKNGLAAYPRFLFLTSIALLLFTSLSQAACTDSCTQSQLSVCGKKPVYCTQASHNSCLQAKCSGKTYYCTDYAGWGWKESNECNARRECYYGECSAGTCVKKLSPEGSDCGNSSCMQCNGNGVCVAMNNTKDSFGKKKCDSPCEFCSAGKCTKIIGAKDSFFPNSWNASCQYCDSSGGASLVMGRKDSFQSNIEGGAFANCEKACHYCDFKGACTAISSKGSESKLDFEEPHACNGVCQRCEEGVCALFTGSEGNQCNGECTRCNNGKCVASRFDDLTECGSENCCAAKSSLEVKCDSSSGEVTAVNAEGGWQKCGSLAISFNPDGNVKELKEDPCYNGIKVWKPVLKAGDYTIRVENEFTGRVAECKFHASVRGFLSVSDNPIMLVLAFTLLIGAAWLFMNQGPRQQEFGYTGGSNYPQRLNNTPSSNPVNPMGGRAEKKNRIEVGLSALPNSDIGPSTITKVLMEKGESETEETGSLMGVPTALDLAKMRLTSEEVDRKNEENIRDRLKKHGWSQEEINEEVRKATENNRNRKNKILNRN